MASSMVFTAASSSTTAPSNASSSMTALSAASAFSEASRSNGILVDIDPLSSADGGVEDAAPLQLASAKVEPNASN
jgi:hypothetical protein